MDDNACDPCECIYSKIAFQRFLLFLRERQNQCTDTECFTTGPRLSLPQDSSTRDFYTFALLIGFVILMYLFRPSSLRQVRYGSTKNRETGPGSSRDPPPPPTMD